MQPADVSRKQWKFGQAPHHHQERGHRFTCAQGSVASPHAACLPLPVFISVFAAMLAPKRKHTIKLLEQTSMTMALQSKVVKFIFG